MSGAPTTGTTCTVGLSGSTTETAPGSFGELTEGLTHPLDSTETGRLLPMMVAQHYDITPAPTPGAPRPGTHVDVECDPTLGWHYDEECQPAPVVAPTPDLPEWRARCLLALALVNHRRTHRGLGEDDTDAVIAALSGKAGA